MDRRIILALAGLAALAGCAWGYQGYSDSGGAPDGSIAYAGRDWVAPRGPYRGELTGPGVAKLDEWLLRTPEGRDIVTLGFTAAARGEVSEETADRVNIWFRRYADTNHDLTLTDPEIRTALVAAGGRYRRR